jgi:hypothetical protein
MNSPEKAFQWVAVAPIHGLFISDEIMDEDILNGHSPLIKLSDVLDVVQLSDEEQKRLFMIEVIRRVGAPRWTDRYFAIRMRYRGPKEGVGQQSAQTAANDKIEQLLQVMRVFKSGGLYLGGIAHWIEEPFTGMINFMSKSWPDNFLPPFSLDKRECITELEAFWQAIQSPDVRARQHISLATRWFSKACELSRIDDKLINLIIAAESLSGSPKGEKATRIATSIVQLMSPTNPEMSHAKEAMIAAYRLRNYVVHEGGVTNDWRKKVDSKFQDETALVHQIEPYIREALRNWIANKAKLTLTCS